jgi:hypothetical protein
MEIGRFVRAASITGAAVFLMAASATASAIKFNTNAAGTDFGGGGLTLKSWEPQQLGPARNNATSGDFRPTVVTSTLFTGIVVRTSGAVPGRSTVLGFIDSVPELPTFGLIGGALIGIGMLRRKRSPRL